MTRARETSEYVQFVQRSVKGLGSRVAAGELDHLRDLLELHELIEDEARKAVAGLRAEPNSYSWRDIGDALGVTRQAAMQRWPGIAGRQAGGQPTSLR